MLLDARKPTDLILVLGIDDFTGSSHQLIARRRQDRFQVGLSEMSQNSDVKILDINLQCSENENLNTVNVDITPRPPYLPDMDSEIFSTNDSSPGILSTQMWLVCHWLDMNCRSTDRFLDFL